MRSTRWPLACLIPLVAFGLAGCGSQGTAPGATEGAEATGPTQDAAAPAESSDAATLVPMIASGTVQVPPTGGPGASPATPEAQATSEGRRRVVPLDEAVAAVPFTLLEPTFLPKGTARGAVVHLMEPFEGQTADYLPAVRFIYDTEGGGSIILLQSPARGEVIEGARTVELDGRTLYITPNDQQTILTWEQGDLNVELRAQYLPMQTMLEIAHSLAPLGSPTATSASGTTGGSADGAAVSTPEAAPATGTQEAVPATGTPGAYRGCAGAARAHRLAMTRRRVGGYIDRQEMAIIRRTNREMIEIAKRLVIEPTLSARMAQLLSRLTVELAEQGKAISEMEQIRRELL